MIYLLRHREASNPNGKNISGLIVMGDDSDARSVIMGRIRDRLGVRADEIGRLGHVHTRLRHPPDHSDILPTIANRTERLKLFQAKLEQSNADVRRVRTLKSLRETIETILQANNLPARIRIGADSIFSNIEVNAGLLELTHGAAEDSDMATVSHAVYAAAETGTLFLTSGPDNPSTLNFMPDLHIIIVQPDDIVQTYEQAWSKLRKTMGSREMPRTVNLISGPSRTADIQQTIVMGAHGPRKLYVLIVGS